MLRCFLLFLSPILLAAATPPPPEIGVATLLADAESQWVDFTLTPGNQIRFAMEVDGRTVAAILDTGASHSVLDRGSAAFAAARVRPGGEAMAIGGTVPIGWMTVRRMALGGLVVSGGEVAVAALPGRATGGGPAVDLLVGRDVVGGQALDIDYRRRRFRLLASGRLPFRGASLPLAVSAQRNLYESAVTLGGRRLAPMIVDTGDGAALTVTAAGWRASGMAPPALLAVTHGVAGPETGGLATAPSATLGEVATGAVEVRIEAAAGLSERIGAAGRIGSALLQRFRVLLDPGAGRMVLGRHGEEPVLVAAAADAARPARRP